ncbi:MAG TPA: N-acetylmuramoyl-L-alanine amidase family protein [Bacillota bacterium]|nr:N-acetylmuramoyl-L-alanine amidase family protein [Bacillota bacterium]
MGQGVYADTKITQNDIDEGITFCKDYPVLLQVDGKKVEGDVPPVIIKEKTLIPVRAVFEDMGADVTWYEDARLVEIRMGSSNVQLTIDSSTALVDGTPKTMDVPAMIIGGRTMIPVRFVGEPLSCGIGWDDLSRTVIIKSPAEPAEPVESAVKTTASIDSVEVKDKSDGYRIVIQGDDAIEGYKTFAYDDPDRFGIDIKNSVLDIDDGKIDSDRDNGIFNSVRYSQFDNNTVRVVVDLAAKVAGKVSFSEDKEKIYIDFDKGQADNHENLGSVTADGLDVVDWRAANKLVVIDPGHGGTDPGTQAIRDGVEILNEKDINLDIALRLNEMLKSAGVSTYILRETDKTITLYDRPALANSAAADIYVSIHNNSNKDHPDAKGTEVFYNTKASESNYGISSKHLADLVYENMMDTVGTFGRGVKSEPAYAVLNKTNMPAILIEGAFLSNTDDLKLMMTDEFRQNYALAAAKAIIQTLNESVEEE